MVDSVQFRFSQNIQDLEGKGILDSPERVDKLTQEEQDATLKGLRLQDPLSRDTINQLYPFVRFYWEVSEKSRKLTGETLARFIHDIYHSGERFEGDAETISITREVCKYYVYFLVFIIRDREKREAEAAAGGIKKTKKKPAISEADEDAILVDDDEPANGGEDEVSTSKKGSKSSANASAWAAERDKHLEALLEVLWVKNEATELGRVFEGGVPQEGFLSLFWQTGELLIERGLTVVRSGSKTRELTLNLLAIPSMLFHDSVGNGMASSLWNTVRQHAHASQLVVELLALLSNQYKQDKLAREMVQQLGETDTLAIHKNVGTLVEELAEKMPSLMLANLSLILPYLNNKESYQMRCSIIRALPFLVQHLHHHVRSGDDAKNGTREKILETLGDWGHDVSPFVRAAVSAAWNQLVETKTLPLSHLLTALDLALEATRDKKVLVRKQALALLENMLASNPFGPDLSVELFVIEIERRKAELEELLDKQEHEAEQKARESEAKENSIEGEDDDEPSLLGIDKPVQVKKEKSSSGLLEVGDDKEQPQEEEQEQEQEEEVEEEETEDDKKKRVLMEALNFLKTAVMFIDKFESSVPYFCSLLTSTTDEDVLGVIRLFATARAFRLSGSDRGVRSMLKLIWHNSEKIRKVLLETMERLYIAETEGTKRFVFPAKVVANNLVDLAQGATLDELTSLGEVVSEMRKTPDQSLLKRTILPLQPVEELWTIILKRKEDIERARVALCVLGMAAISTPQIIDDSRSSAKLIQVAFTSSDNEETDLDLDIARWAFHCLSVACRSRQGKCNLPIEEKKQVEMAAIQIVCGRWSGQTQTERDQWFSACKAALDLIVDLSDSPERTLYFCLENMYEACKSRNFAESRAMSALLFVAGHVALKLLIVGEKLVSEIKRCGNSSKSAKKEANKEEEDMLGATAEDDLEDILYRQLSEIDLFADNSCLWACLDLSRKICLSSTCAPELKQCAVLALCKFMSCSERICEENLSLLFTCLRDSKEAETRSIIVISEGDLAFRFPNALEPFTSHMYKSLRDEHVLVRKNALMVLTHLALNDMIKVRGEVAEIALRLEDDDKGVKDLARFFFAELSKRGSNPIYNLLPDILGSLSREAPGQAKFKGLAKFLLEFVDKDKQCEQLADKLCHRILATLGGVGDFNPQVASVDLQICRDLCFCLEQLKMSDGLLKRLSDDSDLFKCFRPIMGDSACYQSVLRLVQKASPKSQEGKRTMEEMLEKMKKLHDSQSVDMAAYDKANQKRGTKFRINEKNVGDILEQAQEKMNAALADENRADEMNTSKRNTKGKSGAKTATSMVAATKRKPSSRSKAKQEEEDENNEDIEEEEEIVPEKKSTRGTRSRKAIAAEDED